VSPRVYLRILHFSWHRYLYYNFNPSVFSLLSYAKFRAKFSERFRGENKLAAIIYDGFRRVDQLAWLFFSSSSLGERRDQCAWRESALPSRHIIIRPSDFFPRSRCQTCGISIKQPTKASIGTEQTTETMETFLTPWHDRLPWTGCGGCSRRNNCGANATVPSIEVYGQLGVGKSRYLYALSILISSRIYVYSIYWKAVFL